jgi:Uma2 family endonuclease
MQTLDEPVITRHRLTVEKYYQMAEAGVLEPDARVELIDGEVVDMAPIGSKHYGTVLRLNRLLVPAAGNLAIVLVQAPLRLGGWSEPEPDLAVLKPHADDYTTALATEADALLVIEVADTSLAYDLRTKARLYAAHGIPVYWVFDLVNGVLHAHAEPQADGYRRIDEMTNLGPMPLPGLPGTVVDLSGLL